MSARVMDQRGMTLAEVIIAVAIIGVGLVALSSAIPLGAYGVQEGNQLSTATFLANQRMEQARNAKWGGDTDDLTVANFPAETPMAAPYAGYSRSVQIRGCDTGGGCAGIASSDLRQVIVTVSYRPMTGTGMAPAGTAKSAVITMYIAKRP
jgi:prepilin-type N-terminal cleavage/methylation domain-containing protein